MAGGARTDMRPRNQPDPSPKGTEENARQTTRRRTPAANPGTPQLRLHSASTNHEHALLHAAATAEAAEAAARAER